MGKLVAQFVEENRKALKQSGEEPHLLMQDMAPCHCGDECRETGEKDLQRKRRSWYEASNVVNHLYSPNGTPELCVNDQVHKLFQASLHRAINEVVGRGKLLHNRPMAPEDLTLGGPYYTESGIRRGTTPWNYALACSVVWKTFPQLILTAAFVRLRYLSPGMAAKLLDTHQEEIEEGVHSLEEWQRVVQKHTHWTCLHADQDFTGTPHVDRSLSKPTRVSAVDKTEKVIMDALHAALIPTTLSTLAPLGNALPDGGLSRHLEVNRECMGSALTSLASTASALNVGEYHHFDKALALALGRSTYFQKSHSYTSAQLREDIFKFQFAALKKQYFKLVEDKSPQVLKASGGLERQLTLHTYIWDVLKAVHKKDVASLNNLCRIMAGDAKTKSLNVGLRHRRVKPPLAKASFPVAPNFTADELKEDGVHVPAFPTTSALAAATGLPSSSSSLIAPVVASVADSEPLSSLAPKAFFCKDASTTSPQATCEVQCSR